MATKQTERNGTRQTVFRYPLDWKRDFNLDWITGQSSRKKGEREPLKRPASAIQRVVTTLADFAPDELDRIPVLAPGSRLRQGATYVDLADPQRLPVTVNHASVATEDNFYVAEEDVGHAIWDRLLDGTG